MSQGEDTQWELTLYVHGAGPRSAAAIEVVRQFCDAELTGRFELSVFNAADHPADVVRDNILALPTLVKQNPEPRRYVVGDLSDVERLRRALDLGPAPLPPDSNQAGEST